MRGYMRFVDGHNSRSSDSSPGLWGGAHCGGVLGAREFSKISNDHSESSISLPVGMTRGHGYSHV